MFQLWNINEALHKHGKLANLCQIERVVWTLSSCVCDYQKQVEKNAGNRWYAIKSVLFYSFPLPTLSSLGIPQLELTLSWYILPFSIRKMGSEEGSCSEKEKRFLILQVIRLHVCSGAVSGTWAGHSTWTSGHKLQVLKNTCFSGITSGQQFKICSFWSKCDFPLESVLLLTNSCKSLRTLYVLAEYLKSRLQREK